MAKALFDRNDYYHLLQIALETTKMRSSYILTIVFDSLMNRRDT